MSESPPKARLPHTFALLLGLVAVAAVATHIIPAGAYTRVEREGRKVVDPASYHLVEARPAGVADIFLAYPRGLAETSNIVFYIFLIGGAFGVISATGATEAVIASVVHAAHGRGEMVVPLLMILFSIGGGTIGLAEETLPFLPALVVLARRLGYDEITGGAIALVGAGAGFSGAFLNPFTVGVAQGIAGLPLFSGISYRFLVWLVMTTIAVVYVSRYARGVRRDVIPEAENADRPAVTGRQALVLIVLALGLSALVLGSMKYGWGLQELSALCVALAVVCGLCGGLGVNRTAEVFLEGATGIASGALVVGLARGVLVVLDQARVTDTILSAMAGAVGGLPTAVCIAGIYAVQVALSYLVPSGSGQAALSLPILVPLADLVGVTRQTSVLAYQFGDGFSNIFAPTSGYFMAGLALIDVPWTRWARFMWPLQCVWLTAGLGLVLIAQAIHWGPF